MAVKKGYKQTEVGVIPDVWKCATVQELLDSGDIVEHLDGNHGELYPRSHEFTNNGVPYITANDLVDNRVEFSRCKHLSDARAKRFRKGVAKHGDVLFAHNATVGPTAILRTELDYVILSTTVTYYRCRPERLHNAWLLYGLQALMFVAQYRAIMSQSTRNQVPITAQRKLTLVVPPLIEQTAIAGALSDADAWIESLEQLIAKKRQIKQGAMQELLTGKRRLPGFSGQWDEAKLIDIAEGRKELFDDGDWIESEHITNQGIRLVQTGNIGIGCFIEKDDKKYIYESSFMSLGCKEIKSGDLLVCRLAEPAGRACVLPDIGETKVVTSVDVTIFRPPPQKANRVFLANVFSTSEWFREVSERTGGTTHKRIARGALGRITIRLPKVDEQLSIANCLADMDTEIESLESKLAKAREVKQGMMQELLTGRIRLV